MDNVNNPAHYKVGGIETITFIEAKKLNYNLGNVVKYITRADYKGNRTEDLKKARWYLDREIQSQDTEQTLQNIAASCETLATLMPVEPKPEPKPKPKYTVRRKYVGGLSMLKLGKLRGGIRVKHSYMAKAWSVVQEIFQKNDVLSRKDLTDLMHSAAPNKDVSKYISMMLERRGLLVVKP